MDLVPVREGSVKGARFWRGWRTLDGSLSDPTIRSEGKGPGGSGGLTRACPLAEFEAAPQARSSAPSPRSVHHSQLSSVAFRSSRTPRSTSCLCLPHACPLVARLASIRILAAFLGAACTIRFVEFGRGAAIFATASTATEKQNAVIPDKAAHQANKNFGSPAARLNRWSFFLFRFPSTPFSRLRLRRLPDSTIPQRLILGPTHPHRVQQHGQLPRHRRRGQLPRSLFSFPLHRSHQLQSPLPQIAVLPLRPQDVVRTIH